MMDSESGQYLYRIQPVRGTLLTEGPTPEEERSLTEHFAHLQNLTARGVVILAGRTLNADPSSFGIVIFRAESAPQAQRIMEADPAVRSGTMHAELFPYRIALHNTDTV